ncbi:MAG TPA: zinc-binding dehydrogenase [Gemmatimonadales bacterium]|nr:zinc-binding dehydrogenase [Gemmatimonadales bacterium]
MRALALTGVGGLDELAVVDVPVPQIERPDQVRIRIRAGALNRIDLFVTGGLPGMKNQFPHIVGSDGAGDVESVGSAVASVHPGDRVFINPGISCEHCERCIAGEHQLCDTFQVMGEHRSGTLAEYVVVPEANVALVPERMDWPSAAAFPLATLTAWRMLITRAALRPGERVLIWGIGGGVAQASLQVAKLAGASVIVTSSSDSKLEVARRLGADVTVNHATGDPVAEVRSVLGRRGADVIIDSVGEKTWPMSLRLLRRGGRMVVCGATTGPMVSLDARKLFWHQWSILGSTMGSHREFAEIVSLAARGKLWPVVDQVVPLERGVDAYARMARGEQTGKLVIEVSP